MDKIRRATPEEIEILAPEADLNPSAIVAAFDNAATGRPDFAVLKQITVLDPVFFAEGTSGRRKLFFIWSIESILRREPSLLVQNLPASGIVSEYYFDITVSDKKWCSVAEHYGARCISKEPELRFKRMIGSQNSLAPHLRSAER